VTKSPAYSYLSDQLEIDYGTAILEELTNQSLTRKGQSTRLFDQTVKTSEAYYPADKKGKPYIQNFQEGKRWYPISAWMQAHELDWKTTVQDLATRYLGDAVGSGKGGRKYHSHSSITNTPKLPASYHDPAFVGNTLADYERNNFALFLRRLMGIPVADELLALFRVGTWPGGVAREWQRCTIYWQVDEQERIHAGKVMYYHQGTGKRIKEECPDFAAPAWAHKLMGLSTFNLEQCLFGLHQLATQSASKPIALVESEKTAIIATAFEPGFIWLACGGLSNLTADRCRVLVGRSITLFPDLGGYPLWSIKAEELKRSGHTVSVSRILEHRASSLERKAGLDLADYLTTHRCDTTGRVLTEVDGYPALWDCAPGNLTPTIQVKTLDQYLTQTNQHDQH
jgi:hypothetical protein